MFSVWYNGAPIVHLRGSFMNDNVASLVDRRRKQIQRESRPYRPSRPQSIFVPVNGVLADVRHREHYLQKSPPDYDAWRIASVNDTPIETNLCMLHEAIYRYGSKPMQVILYFDVAIDIEKNIGKDAATALMNHISTWSQALGLSSIDLCLMEVMGRYNVPFWRIMDEVLLPQKERLFYNNNIIFWFDSCLKSVEIWQNHGVDGILCPSP